MEANSAVEKYILDLDSRPRRVMPAPVITDLPEVDAENWVGSQAHRWTDWTDWASPFEMGENKEPLVHCKWMRLRSLVAEDKRMD